MLSGVLRRRSRGPDRNGPTIMMMREAMPVRVMQQPMVLERSSRCMAPKYWDTMMLAPTEMPINRTSIRFRIGPALPTAARALSPTKRPTIMLSTVLYSCCAILPSSMGMVNRTICFTGLPTRISTVSKRFIEFLRLICYADVCGEKEFADYHTGSRCRIQDGIRKNVQITGRKKACDLNRKSGCAKCPEAQKKHGRRPCKT